MPVIVLNGGPGFGHSYLRPHLDALAKQNKIIYYDQRCCGFSPGDAATQTLTIDQYVADLEALRQTLGIERFVLLGHSWGTHLALRYAIKHPDHLAGMVLMSSCPASTEELGTMAAALEHRLSIHQNVLDRIRDSKPFQEHNPSTVEAFYTLVVSAQVSNPADAKKIQVNFSEEAARNIATVNPTLFGELFSNPFNLYSELKKIHVPTLVLHGEEDFIPQTSARKIQAALPEASYIEIVDAGHYPFAEKEHETLSTVSDFLRKIN